MKLRLKNKGLQVHLDAISNGDFTKKLNSFVKIERFARIYFGEEVDARFTYGIYAEGKFSITLTADDVEEIPEYNPRKWNEYMKVMPPTGVLMRVEIQESDRQNPIKTSGIYDGSRWSFFAHGFCSPCTIRFRPWDDEEDEE